MAYKYDYGAGQRLILDNSGTQTIITLSSSGAGQQQQASQTLQTGIWTAPPVLFQTAGGLVIKLHTATGELFVQVQANRLSQVNADAVGSAQPLPLQQMPSPSPMPPMAPMQPMQTGNLSMSLSPMEMRMGNMQMQMGGASPASNRFCSQCGAGIKPDDRFCASCGVRLESASV
jgi:hypothetical protein